jgi:C-terminal processing protease CtpA/Prc
LKDEWELTKLANTAQPRGRRQRIGAKGIKKLCLISILTAVATAMSLASGLFGAFAQSSPDSYTTGVSIIAGSKKSCPIFIGGVAAKSPAEQAGISPGDRLLAVGGKDVKGMQLADVAKLIRSEQPGAVTLKLWRKGKEYEAVLQRQKFSSLFAEEGKKLTGDFLVPLDTTDEEVKRMMKNEERPVAGRAFPLHYPLNTDLYYGGFEIFIFANPAQISVGGLEQGAASRAGIHQSDVILSVNGVDPTGKNPQELEALFSSAQGKLLKLVVDRVGVTKTLEFQLEKASDVLKENHRRLVKGELIPDGLAEEDIPCLTEGLSK